MRKSWIMIGCTLAATAMLAGCAEKQTAGNTDTVKTAVLESISHEGKTQITWIFTATPAQEAEGDRLFASHAKWMEQTHHRTGDLALLLYNVVKGPEASNPLDPYSEPSANKCFVLTEVYEKPAGLADHWKQGAATWQDFNAFVSWAGSVKVAVLHGSPVIHSLW